MSDLTPGQRGLAVQEANAALPDAARRRHMSKAGDFDLRVNSLEIEILPDWEPQIIEQWTRIKTSSRAGLVAEFSALAAERKEENFIAIGPLSMSIISYHNILHRQVRNAFVLGSYYPALVGACALGERVLNHLILDLREFYTGTPQYRRVARKQSFDNWTLAIDTLEAWGVLISEAVAHYRALASLRHRSVHFDPGTYGRLREDALAAVIAIREILDLQFSTFAVRPWFIPDAHGTCFITKTYETDPFIRTYFIPNCVFVGPHHLIHAIEPEMVVVDKPDYGSDPWSDTEFKTLYGTRRPEDIAVAPGAESDDSSPGETSAV